MFRRGQRDGSQRGSALARLLLLLLAWSQLALAAHQADHSIDTIDETCAVCLQFERNDDAVPVVETLDSVPEGPHTAIADESVASRSQTFVFYRSRASP